MVWSDKFIARVPSDAIDTCSVRISIIDARGNGGHGKIISFLSDATLSDLINMDDEPSRSSTISCRMMLKFKLLSKDTVQIELPEGKVIAKITTIFKD